MSDTLAPNNPFLDEAAPTLVAEEVFHPEIHPDTLGKQQVYDANQIAQYTIGMDPEPNGAGAHGELLRWQDSLHADLGEVRTIIRSIPQSMRADCGVAVYESLSTFQQKIVQEWLGEDKDDLSKVLDWLVERPTKDLRGSAQGPGEEFPLRKADYDQRLLNFLQSHSEYIKGRQQDPEFLREVEVEKETWLLGVRYGVDSGWLDRSAIDRSERLDQIKVYEGDVFTTFAEDRNGYNLLGGDNVVVAKDSTSVTPHELNHNLLDGEDPDHYKELDLKKEAEKAEWERMEAMTEHAALVFRGEILEVEHDNGEVGVYNKEREKHLYDPVRKARYFGVDLKIADFMLFYSSEGEDREKYKRKITEKIAEIRAHEEGYIS